MNNLLTKEVHDRCDLAVKLFKEQRPKKNILCLYEYADLDFDYPVMLFAMEDNEENEALMYQILGELTMIQNELLSEDRKSYNIEVETILS